MQTHVVLSWSFSLAGQMQCWLTGSLINPLSQSQWEPVSFSKGGHWHNPEVLFLMNDSSHLQKPKSMCSFNPHTQFPLVESLWNPDLQTQISFWRISFSGQWQIFVLESLMNPLTEKRYIFFQIIFQTFYLITCITHALFSYLMFV